VARTHVFKTHHLNLDETGAVIVSTGVFERIKARLALDGFRRHERGRERPPAIGVGLAADVRCLGRHPDRPLTYQHERA
jgi:hypothetical protein